MNINLSIDIPKEYNDMSQGELAQLSVNIKKLVDDINYVFSQIDEQNLTNVFKMRLDSIQKTAESTQKAYNSYISTQSKCKFHVSLTNGNRVFDVSDYTTAGLDGKAVLIIPDVASDNYFKWGGIYISQIEGTKIYLSWTNRDWGQMPNIGFTVVLI